MSYVFVYTSLLYNVYSYNKIVQATVRKVGEPLDHFLGNDQDCVSVVRKRVCDIVGCDMSV